MVSELNERTAAILDSASTWDGVARVVTENSETTTLRLGGRAFGRVGTATVEAHFPGKLSRVIVRHGRADTETGEGWTRLDDPTVKAATELLWLSYLSHVGRARRRQPDAYPSVDIDDGLAELDLSPGVIHLVREQARS